MAFCSKCGAQVEDGVKFCPACGNDLSAENAAPAADTAAQSAQTGAESAAQNAFQNLQGLNQTADTTSEYDPKDIADNKVMAILAYILFFIPLIAGTYKTSPYVKFHTNQGTALFILYAAYGIVQRVLLTIFYVVFSHLLWGIYVLISAVLGLLWLIPFVLFIIGIVNAANGKAKELPIIGGFKIIK